jgi:transposase
VISTVTDKGQMRWRIFEGAINAKILIDFLRRLIKGATKKVFLILDNLRVHHAKPVKAWLAEHVDAIEVFYLPSYSPELNPYEMANADIKQVVRNWRLYAPSCSWSRRLLAIYAVCSVSPRGFASISSMIPFAMPLDSTSLMPDQ